MDDNKVEIVEEKVKERVLRYATGVVDAVAAVRKHKRAVRQLEERAANIAARTAKIGKWEAKIAAAREANEAHEAVLDAAQGNLLPKKDAEAAWGKIKGCSDAIDGMEKGEKKKRKDGAP